MAGAGGTGPQKSQQPDQLEQMRESLVQAIMQHIGGPEPTPPQYQPAPISPLQGYAIARNPQAAGLINQTIQAPGQARYMQQRDAFEQAMAGRHQAMNVGAALIGQQERQNISPLDILRLQETMRHNQATEGKPEKAREQVVYDKNNQAHILNLDTGQMRDVPGLAKPPTQGQETAMRSAAVLKLRVQEARDLIEGGGSRASRIPQAILSHDPTGIVSGGDYTANATTYNSFINEIGSLTRSLYGAQGIRSYEEIIRLINTMPPWSSGPQRIKQQFDALEKAIGTADAELRNVRPDLFTDQPAAPANPTGDAKSRLKAKYGVP